MDLPTITVHQQAGTLGEGAQMIGVQLIVQGLDQLPTRYDGRVKGFLEYYVGTLDRPAPFGGRQADLAALDARLGGERAVRKTAQAIMVRPGGGREEEIAEAAEGC